MELFVVCIHSLWSDVWHMPLHVCKCGSYSLVYLVQAGVIWKEETLNELPSSNCL